MNEIIVFELLDLTGEKFTDRMVSTLTLREDSVIWEIRGYSDIVKNRDDPDMGWKKNALKAGRVIARKSLIAGVGKSYFPESNLWLVYISTSGIAIDIELYFKRESQANEVLEKLDRYLYPNEYPTPNPTNSTD